MYAYIVTVGQMRQYSDIWDTDLNQFQGVPDEEKFVVFSEKKLDFLPENCQAECQLIMDSGETIDATSFGFEELGFRGKPDKDHLW